MRQGELLFVQDNTLEYAAKEIKELLAALAIVVIN